jgi:23S rRNA (uracil1939-C5)-methyltransferase
VVLDPPRAGLGSDVTEKLMRLAPQRIAYLSCDPSTLARDLAALTGVSSGKGVSEQAGARYEIREVHLFDLFPQTYHIESLVMLERRK